jgi:prevent-host-death family protein
MGVLSVGSGRHSGASVPPLPAASIYVHNVHIMGQASVNMTELRSRLSAYLNRVRDGEEILIRDRNMAIAKLVPLSDAEDFKEEILGLAALGLVRLPGKRLNLRAFFATPAPRIPIARLQGAIEAEREED